MGTPCIDCGVPGHKVLCPPCKDGRRNARSAPVDLRALIRTSA